MALTLTQKPTTPNASRTNLLYTLTSDSSSKDQFRYIVTVSTDEIPTITGLEYPEVTLRYYPNTTGSGIIDLAPIFNRYLAWDQNSQAWSQSPQTPASSAASSTVHFFTCSFGEEFADSPSSSLQVHTGSIEEIIHVFQGKVDIESGDYNFNTSSLLSNNNNIFSDMPDVIYSQSQYDFFLECPKIDVGDYQTLTTLQQTDYEIKVYDEGADMYTGSLLLTITGSTPSEEISTIGVGSSNIMFNSGVPNRGIMSGSDAAWLTFTQTSPTAYKPVNFMLRNHSMYPCNKAFRGSDSSPGTEQNVDEHVRFVWQNNYGMWDWYNVYNTLRQVDNVERETYTKPFPIYDQTTSPFNINNRGEKQISSILTEQFSITTDYVSKKTADWLTQLFDSNNVYLYLPVSVGGNPPYLEDQYGTDLRAIVINNVNYRWQENKFRNKTFQYDINWSFSNKTFVY